MNGLVLDFFKISPRNTSLETLKVDTEFGYRVTPIAKYPLTRIPISNGGLVVSTQQARILQVRNLSETPQKNKKVSGPLICVLVDRTPLKVRQKTKKPKKTGEQEILQPIAMMSCT